MKLTDEQAEILAVCAACQNPLDIEAVRREVEAGRTTPVQYFCLRCKNDPERIHGAMFTLGTYKAADLAEDRFRRAGVMEYLNGVADEINLRRQNRQN